MLHPRRIVMLRPLATALLLGALALPAGAQPAGQPERLAIPLTDPARPATLEVSLIMGGVTLVAGQAGQVVVTATPSGDVEQREEAAAYEEELEADLEQRRQRRDRAGMKRIADNSFGFQAEEADNRVEVSGDSWMRPFDLRIEVPAASTVEVSTVNGAITVEGLSGELVLHDTNGPITVRDVTGPVNASTVNGDVEVVFGPNMAAEAMAFSTLNGDIDLILPRDAKVDVLLRSDNGEILSDFDVALEQRPARVEQGGKKQRGYRVGVERQLAGKIGGGGPELFLKTFNGDILLRRAK
jgi:hypothetical protein